MRNQKSLSWARNKLQNTFELLWSDLFIWQTQFPIILLYYFSQFFVKIEMAISYKIDEFVFAIFLLFLIDNLKFRNWLWFIKVLNFSVSDFEQFLSLLNRKNLCLIVFYLLEEHFSLEIYVCLICFDKCFLFTVLLTLRRRLFFFLNFHSTKTLIWSRSFFD